MAIKKKEDVKISFELWDTVDAMPHIEEVHFTAKNNHYFNSYELFELTKGKNKKATGKFYGHLKLEQVPSHEVGTKQFYKLVEVANPDTLIVVTLTRDEVLAKIPVDIKEIHGLIEGSRARAFANDQVKKKEPAKATA